MNTNLLFRMNQPKNLVREIVYQLPVYLFESDSTLFLDPAMGGGDYLRSVINRLIEFGHSVENIASRIYGIEDNIIFVNRAKMRNIGNFIQMSYNEVLEWESDMRFDVIIGNPPYQSNNGAGTLAGSSKPLWFEFVKLSLNKLKDGGYLSFITPQNMFNGSSSFTKNFIGNKAIIGINRIDFDTDNYFNVGVKTCRWQISKDRIPGVTLVNGKEIDLTKVSLILKDSLSMSIIHKIANLSENRLSFSTAGRFDIGPATKRLGREMAIPSDIKTNTHIYSVDINGNEKFVPIIMGDYTDHKVFIPILSKVKPFYVRNMMHGGGGTFSMSVSSSGEGKNLAHLMNCSLYQFVINETKVGGRVSSKMNILPLLNLSKKWTDKEIYEHFNLTDEEIAYIESQVT